MITTRTKIRAALAVCALSAAAVLAISPFVSINGSAGLMPHFQRTGLDVDVRVMDIDKAKFVAHALHLFDHESAWDQTEVDYLMALAYERGQLPTLYRLQRFVDGESLDEAGVELATVVVELLRGSGYALVYPTLDAEELVVALQTDSLDQFFVDRI